MKHWRSLTKDDLPAAVATLIAPPDTSLAPDSAPVQTFLSYLTTCDVGWEGLLSGTAQQPSALSLTLLLPGNTALVMIINPERRGVDLELQHDVTAAGLAQLEPRNLHYAQALVELPAERMRTLLEQQGFQMMAPLVYLERGVTYPWTDPVTAREAEWLSYSPRTHDEFADVVLATYEGSLDCPELAGLRPADDILAAHKASGHFDPRLWEIAYVQGQPAGCLLLAPLVHGPAIEIVYVGVLASWRGRGVGRLLLRQALDQSRRKRARTLTTVVDDRNAPARRLYDGFQFKPVGIRDALLYRWE